MTPSPAYLGTEKPWRWGVIIPLLWAIVLVGSKISETRIYRDLAGRTPFHAVEVNEIRPDNGAVVVAGTFTHRRCVRTAVSAYVTSDDGSVTLAAVFSEGTSTNPGADRMIHGLTVGWGPWIIQPVAPMDAPQTWHLTIRHDCPEGPVTDSFASGPWVQ